MGGGERPSAVLEPWRGAASINQVDAANLEREILDTKGSCFKESQRDLTEHELVLKAVDFLYKDGLKPYGRILRKRMGELSRSHATTSDGEGRDFDMKGLRALCEASPVLFVEVEDGGEWSAHLRGRTQNFIDVYSPIDTYPKELWDAAASYFEQLEDSEMVLRGGRYSIAASLLKQNLTFLRGRSLGEVCHIVQLAISQKKLLGYRSGEIVPYSRSQSMVKENCAKTGRPVTTAKHTFATWDKVRSCLRELLRNEDGTDIQVPLSNVKRVFRSRFKVELSETQLGYAKLSGLLNAPELEDICRVELKGNAYFVIPVGATNESHNAHTSESSEISLGPQAAPPARVSLRDRVHFISPLRLDEPSGAQGPDAAQAVRPSGASAVEVMAWNANSLLSPSVICQGGCYGDIMKNTFIHAGPSPPTPPPGSMRRSNSVPKDSGSVKSAWEATCHAVGFMTRPAHAETCGTCFATDAEACSPGFLEPTGLTGLSTPLFYGEPYTGSYEPWPFFGENGSTGAMPVSLDQPPKTGSGEQSGVAQHLEEPHMSTRAALSPTSLSKDGRIGRLVQNTFIHTAVPTTPHGEASHRSKSLPRSMGSDKVPWEATCHALGYLPRPVDSPIKGEAPEQQQPHQQASRHELILMNLL